MSDEDPALTPEQEARLRSLLAEARPDPRREALPSEVAARLDFVLSDLAGQPLETGTSDPAVADGSVAHLAARRRRRVGGLLLAAAAVAVAAVGVGQVVDLRSGSGEDAASTESAAVDSGEGADRGAAGSASAGGDSSLSAEEAAPDPSGLARSQDLALPSTPLAEVVRVRVRSKQFSEDAAAVRRALGRVKTREEFVAPAPGALPAPLRTRRVFECAATDLGPGTWVAVVYDGSPAVLVFRHAPGEAQVAELVQCGSGEILRSTTLPARRAR